MSTTLQLIKVTLNYDEVVKAHEIGFKRAKEVNWTGDNHARRKSLNSNYHSFIAELSESVASEMVVAKWLGLVDFEPTVNGFKNQADVGSQIEVKWTRWHDGHLIINHYDRDTDIAFLVTGQSPIYLIVGWTPIKASKVPQHWVNAENNWWVPQKELRPMDTLKGSIYATTAL